MIKHLNNFFKRIFNNEETVIFTLIIAFTLIVLSFFAAILTPFIVSIVAAYLLVGLQKKIESYNVSETIAKILSFSIFIIIGAVMVIWLLPLLYGQLTKFIGDIPGFYAAFMKYVAEKSASYPALVESGQLQVILQSVSQELSSITPNLVNSSISGIQNSLSMLLYVMIFPILVYFFFFDRKRIINGCVKIIPGDRKMLSKVWLEMDTQLSNYIRGKVVEIVIVGTAAAILFGSFGLNLLRLTMKCRWYLFF